ncbi:MAG: hypothetical protein IBJ11_04970 [Phycisphaerales bacterium]|nr:hypothetical protein [Phycisphaerales bacterium]
MVAAPSRSRRRAFALLDALVGAVLLGLGLAAIVGLSASAISSQTRGEELERAAALADQKLNLVLAVGPDRFGAAFPTRGPGDAPYEDLTYELTITSRGDTDPFFVRCTVTWGPRFSPRSLSVETLIAARRGDDPDPDRKPDQSVDRSQAGLTPSQRSNSSTTPRSGTGR